MKVIIDIPEDMYNDIQKYLTDNSQCYALSDYELREVIRNGKSYKERPQGEWIVGQYMDCHSDILPKYTCPFCGEVAYRKYDFCHCGADMRGGRE